MGVSCGLLGIEAIGSRTAYGPNVADLYRRIATYVDKILKGAKPADLPVEQPTRFDLIINITTVKALNLEIPPTLLALANEVSSEDRNACSGT